MLVVYMWMFNISDIIIVYIYISGRISDETVIKKNTNAETFMGCFFLNHFNYMTTSLLWDQHITDIMVS